MFFGPNGILIDFLEMYKTHDLSCISESLFSVTGWIALLWFQCLIENGADLDCKNEEEQTPLHLAAKNGRTK